MLFHDHWFRNVTKVMNKTLHEDITDYKRAESEIIDSALLQSENRFNEQIRLYRFQF